jgi:hypothetical protein
METGMNKDGVWNAGSVTFRFIHLNFISFLLTNLYYESKIVILS